MNILQNGSFENGANGHNAMVYTPNSVYQTTRGEVNTPRDWMPYYKHAREFNPPWDTDNHDGWCEPEIVIIPNQTPYLYPPRVADGQAALKIFTTYRIAHAGIFQRVPTAPGEVLRLSALVHAWSLTGSDDPFTSTGVGQGPTYADEGAYGDDLGKGNFTFRVGIDPFGGTDPFADTVVWGDGAHVYNAYHTTPEVTVEAQGEFVTVFVEYHNKLRFAHNDAYIDNVVLETVYDEEEPEETPVDYVVVAELLPQDATVDEKIQVTRAVHDYKRTITQSTGDAARLVAPGLPGSKVEVWGNANRFPAGLDEWLYLQGVDEVTHFQFNGSTPPPTVPPPTPGWSPRRYVHKGTKLGFHCSGGYPVDRVQTLAAQGVTLATTKLVQSIGDVAQAVEPFKIVRLIDHAGQNLEGFNYGGNPEAQAEARMAALIPLLLPYRDKVSFLEITNEQAPPNNAAFAELARFYVRAMQIAEANGFKLALFSQSVGCPEPGAWDAIAPTGVFEAAAAGGHAISLHEYGDARFAPDSVLCRYRYLYNIHILPRQLDIPLFITEFAVWEHLIGQVNSFEQWVRYDQLVRQDPYVAGVHIYSLGMVPGAYVPETVAQLGRFVDYAVAEKDKVNA